MSDPEGTQSWSRRCCQKLCKGEGKRPTCWKVICRHNGHISMHARALSPSHRILSDIYLNIILTKK